MTIVMSEKRTSATMEKMTPGPANRVDRQPPSKANPVSTTPTVAMVAPTAWRAVRVSPRKMTDRTTVEPAEGRDDAADDGDRADLEPGEVREVGARRR